MVDSNVEICLKRLHSLGYAVSDAVVIQGPFAALLIRAEAGTDAYPMETLLYKQPERERLGEVELMAALGQELSPWLSHIIAVFADPPHALLMRDAGEPLNRCQALQTDSLLRETVLAQISEQLAELHASTWEPIRTWLQEGKIKLYPYSRSWADWSLAQADRLRLTGVSWLTAETIQWLREFTDLFYRRYSDALLRSPIVLTHGDVHWGNVLYRENKLTFIDWEWSAAASPMRDIAVLLQDEPDEALVQRMAEDHAMRLLARGYPGKMEDLMHDFYWMLADNTLMMLGWEMELYFRKEMTEERLQAALFMKVNRIKRMWKDYLHKEGL